MKIAWGITGAGHHIRESFEIIEKLTNRDIKVDMFFSEAGEAVAKMYGIMKKLERLKQKDNSFLRRIYFDKDQPPGYPISAKFNLHSYDVLVLSPLTANSVAKINVGIADTLITNIFSQMVKGNGKIIVFPCDLIAGEVETETPSGDKVKIHIDQFNSENARQLSKFPNVTIISHPNEIEQFLDENE